MLVALLGLLSVPARADDGHALILRDHDRVERPAPDPDDLFDMSAEQIAEYEGYLLLDEFARKWEEDSSRLRWSSVATRLYGVSYPESFKLNTGAVQELGIYEKWGECRIQGVRVRYYRHESRVDESSSGPIGALTFEGRDATWFLLLVRAHTRMLATWTTPEDDDLWINPADAGLIWAQHCATADAEERLRRLCILKFIDKMKARGLTTETAIPIAAVEKFRAKLADIPIEGTWSSTDTDANRLAARAITALEEAVTEAGGGTTADSGYGGGLMGVGF